MFMSDLIDRDGFRHVGIVLMHDGRLLRAVPAGGGQFCGGCGAVNALNSRCTVSCMKSTD
jgi:hypothetical protein